MPSLLSPEIPAAPANASRSDLNDLIFTSPAFTSLIVAYGPAPRLHDFHPRFAMREAKNQGPGGPRQHGNKEGSDSRSKPAKRAKDGSLRLEPGVRSCSLRKQPQ